MSWSPTLACTRRGRMSSAFSSAPAFVKIAVMDGGGDHAELGRRLLQAAGGELADGESGRGLQIVTGLFPGSCGAEPTSTCTGLTPAKQVWIVIERPAQNES